MYKPSIRCRRWLSTPILPIWNTMPAKVETTLALLGLSPVGGKPVVACFDGGHLSSDGWLLAAEVAWLEDCGSKPHTAFKGVPT